MVKTSVILKLVTSASGDGSSLFNTDTKVRPRKLFTSSGLIVGFVTVGAAVGGVVWARAPGATTQRSSAAMVNFIFVFNAHANLSAIQVAFVYEVKN